MSNYVHYLCSELLLIINVAQTIQITENKQSSGDFGF